MPCIITPLTELSPSQLFPVPLNVFGPCELKNMYVYIRFSTAIEANFASNKFDLITNQENKKAWIDSPVTH